MLVLSRRVGESIGVGDGIVITIVALKKGAVRIGITAPRDVPIIRDDARQRVARVASDEWPVASLECREPADVTA
jgi:carbon storage regulator